MNFSSYRELNSHCVNKCILGYFIVYQTYNQVVNHNNCVFSYHIPHAAPSIKLLQGVEDTMIECTTTCNNLISWRVHTQLGDRNGHWYEVTKTNKSRSVCTETIALTPVWATHSVNAVLVQCVAVFVCPSEAHTTCLHGVCLSDIQGKLWIIMLMP